MKTVHGALCGLGHCIWKDILSLLNVIFQCCPQAAEHKSSLRTYIAKKAQKLNGLGVQQCVILPADSELRANLLALWAAIFGRDLPTR